MGFFISEPLGKIFELFGLLLCIEELTSARQARPEVEKAVTLSPSIEPQAEFSSDHSTGPSPALPVDFQAKFVASGRWGGNEVILEKVTKKLPIFRAFSTHSARPRLEPRVRRSPRLSPNLVQPRCTCLVVLTPERFYGQLALLRKVS